MERNTFGKKTLNTQRPRVDRFVVPRDTFTDIRKRRSSRSICNQDKADIWFPKYLQQKKYASYLDEALGLEPLKADCKDREKVQAWPCNPRKKRYLLSADSILDLPTYSYAAFPELLDWSNCNILVAALGRNYHNWCWRTQSLVNRGFSHYDIQCCKFDPQGELLALGTDMKLVEIHNNMLSKGVTGSCCRCEVVASHYCSITAVDWSPTGNSFVTGCSWGMVVSFSRQAELINCRRVVTEAVLVARVSPDARYVAVAAVNSPAVILLTWPDLELFSTLNADWIIKTIAWHPWRSALLGVGAETGNLQAQVVLWDAPSSTTQETTLSHRHYNLDAMLFSNKTGELVISLWNSERPTLQTKTCAQLVVMSDPDTVVDQWGAGRSGLDRVRTMVFSPDGTKLATATSDEDLIIWNFLPEDNKKKKKTKCRRFSAIPVYLDKAMHGFSLR